MATAESIDALAAAREEGRAEAIREFQAVVDLTREIFGGIVEIRNDYDPSYPEEAWMTVVVDVDATVGDVRFEKELEWHRRRQEIVKHPDPFRLYVRRVR